MSAGVRSEIVDFLRRELIGPDPGFPAQQLNREEILRPQDPPRLRYSAGVLFPRKAEVSIAETATEVEVESESARCRKPRNWRMKIPVSVIRGRMIAGKARFRRIRK